MDDKKQLKLIKLLIIFGSLAAIGYIAIGSILHLPEHSDLELGGELEKDSFDSFQIESGFGMIELFENYQQQGTKIGEASLTYTNEDLGFEISKPNLSWTFNSNLDVITQENNEQFLANGFRGGIYLEQNNEKIFFVAAFDISEQDQFLLDDYIHTQIDYLQNKFETQIIIESVSQDNDWAIFGTKVILGNSSSYGEQLLHLQNDTLFMLQYTGLPPDELSENDKEERRMIVDSFTII